MYYFKQFSLALLRSFNVKTVPYEPTQFSSIWLIDMALSGATTKVDQGVMAMKRYSAFPRAPALLEPHHQIV